MAEKRRENSLLTSLNELRNVEEERLKEEEDVVRQKAEAEARAREEALRRAREEEEAKVRAAEDKVRKEREDKERKRREEQLRLEEAERRAHIEAQAKLDEARIQAEAQIRVSKRVPVRIIATIVTIAIVVSGGTIYYMYTKHVEEQRLAEAEARRKIEEAEKEQQRIRDEAEAQKRAAQKRLEDLQGKLNSATSEAEKVKLRQQIADEERRHTPRPGKKGGGKGEGTPANTESADPLGNLPGL